MTTLQHAAREARHTTMGFLKDALPPALAVARTEWGMSAVELPDPVAYDAYETQVLDVLPRLSMNLGRTTRFGRVGLDAFGAQEYQVRSQCRVYCWVKFVDEFPTLQVRDDYVTVLASVLLATPSLGSGGVMRVEEDTVEVSYSDVTKVKGERWLAGGAVAFDLTHTWKLRRVPIGDADTVTVETTVLPRHPGLD